MPPRSRSRYISIKAAVLLVGVLAVSAVRPLEGGVVGAAAALVLILMSGAERGAAGTRGS